MRDEDLREEFASWLRPIREAEPPAMPLIRRRLRRRQGRNVGAVIVVLAVVAGTVLALHLSGGTTRPVAAGASPAQERYQSSAAYAVSSSLTTLVVTGGVGEVSIAGSKQAMTSVTDEISYSATAPVLSRVVTGKILTLGSTCPVQQLCVVDYDIQVPSGVAVRVSLRAGTIRLSGLAGQVTATTGVGTISALDLGSRTVSLRTGVGEIDAGFTVPPDTVQASAQTGEINIGVPGTVSYQVNAQAIDTEINVAVSTSSRYVITASTGTGAITVVTGAPATSPAAALNSGTAGPSGFPFAPPTGFPFAP
jgi:hypothetical protein